jgi:hypothetical protein
MPSTFEIIIISAWIMICIIRLFDFYFNVYKKDDKLKEDELEKNKNESLIEVHENETNEMVEVKIN